MKLHPTLQKLIFLISEIKDKLYYTGLNVRNAQITYDIVPQDPILFNKILNICKQCDLEIIKQDLPYTDTNDIQHNLYYTIMAKFSNVGSLPIIGLLPPESAPDYQMSKKYKGE